LFLTWTSCKNWKHPEMKIQKGIRKWNQKIKFVSIQTVIGWIDLARSGEKQKKEIRRKDMNSEFRFWGEIVVATIIILNEWIFLNWSLMRLNQIDDDYYLRLRWDIIHVHKFIKNILIVWYITDYNKMFIYSFFFLLKTIITYSIIQNFFLEIFKNIETFKPKIKRKYCNFFNE
jgi:hypothetical protein